MQEKSIERIKALIKEANNTNVINDLLDINTKLATFLFWLHSEENDAYRTYLDAYQLRKVEEATKSIEGTGNSQAERDKRAIIETKEFKELEIKSELMYLRLKGHRLSVTEFIDVLKQKIAHLRKETELNKN